MGAKEDYLKKVKEAAEARQKLAIHTIVEYKIMEERFNKIKGYLHSENLVAKDEAEKAKLEMEKAKKWMYRWMENSRYDKSATDAKIEAKIRQTSASEEGWESDNYWDDKDKDGRWEKELNNAKATYEARSKELIDASYEYSQELKKKGLDEKERRDRMDKEHNDCEKDWWEKQKRQGDFERYINEVGMRAWECNAVCKSIPDHLCGRHTYDEACWQHAA